VSENLNSLLSQANEARDAGLWKKAAELYHHLAVRVPNTPEPKHNLGLCYLALGKPQDTLVWCSKALAQKPQLWQSMVLLGKAHKALDQIVEAVTCFQNALAVDSNNAEARLALADLSLNQFGEPFAAIEWVKPLKTNPDYKMDAQLTTLMASLYDRLDWDEPHNAKHLSDSIRDFSSKHLRLPELQLPTLKKSKNTKRPRVGLLSPQFFISPVYFLTIEGWRKISKDCDIVIFNRGHKADLGTAEFKSLSSEWHDVQYMNASHLARTIHDSDIDVLYDLGGWMDPVGLTALSAKPARQQFKWVGGQSVTTGLTSFDGWIGDANQSPPKFQSLYSEPLIEVPGSYATYTPPGYMPKPALHKSSTPCIFANPAKISRPFLARLRKMPGKKVFIHRQFRFARVQERILAGLGDDSGGVEFIIPSSHEDALNALNSHGTMIDTFPYSSGLTAREALALGTKIQVLEVGQLFCERHTAYVA